MPEADQLIRTKLRLPFTRAGTLARPRLQERILHGLAGPLTLVIAPAGFGKTTLVATAIAACASPIAWLSLDKNDNQAGRFLRYLVTALCEAGTLIGEGTQRLASSPQPAPAEAVLTGLINDLEASGQEINLVLDDYQFIDNPAAHEAITFLLDHHPSCLHLLIATRSDPALPLARLRARGQTVELRAADLSFTELEAQEFLQDVMGLRLDAPSVALLKERTEGWVAGLQMAALSMRDRKDIAGFIAGFSGTNRYILDYLVEEVLASQPPEIQRFLLRTSILERLTAPLCDALLNEPKGPRRETEVDPPARATSVYPGGSAGILEYLERANLFLVPLDDERAWYRYHHLFADLLRMQLQKSVGAAGLARLHHGAAEWCEHHGEVLDAIQHASMACDDEMLERLIEQNYLEMMNRGEMHSIRSWIGNLAKDWADRRPWLCLYEAFGCSWFGQLERASMMLDKAEKHIRSEATTPGTRFMLAYHAYVQSRVTAMQGDTGRAIDLCLAACQDIPADNLALHIETSMTLGYVYFLYGDFANASQTLHALIRSCVVAGAVNNAVAAYCILARMDICQGRLHEAQGSLEKATQLIEQAGSRNLGVMGLVEVETASLLYEWNDLKGALTHLNKGLGLLPYWGKADDFCLAYLMLSRIQLAQGDRAAALDAIRKAAQLAQTSGIFSEARTRVELAQVRSWLAESDDLAVDRWAAALETNTSSRDSFAYEDEPARTMQARVLIARNKPDEAMDRLSRLEASARSARRNGSLIEIMLLEALAAQTAGDAAQANRALAQCLKLAEPGGYIRTFLDEGQPMQMLLARWLSSASAGPLRDYAARLLSQFGAELQAAPQPDRAAPADGLIDSLTPRELEVLHLIAIGSTNQEIALQLVVSPGTVKAHSASIYRKLGVANRTEAASRARELGILR